MKKVEELNEYDLTIFKKIESILSLNLASIHIELEEKWNKELIKYILEKNPKNKKLALYLIWELDDNYFKILSPELKTDKDIILLAIKRNSKNFYEINTTFKADIEIAKEMINSMLRESKDLFEIVEFINKNFLEQEKELLKFYEKNLSKFGDIILDDLNKTFFILSENNKDFIRELRNNKVIVIKRRKYIINPNFIKEFNDYLSKIEWFDEKSDQEKLIIKRSKLIFDFWLKNNILNKDIEYVINLIIDLSFINNQQDTLEKENIKKDQEKKDSKNLEDKNIKKTTTNDSKEVILEDRIDLFLPNYSYSYQWDYINIITNENINIKISNLEKNEFTTKALENFIEFYKIFYKLWLNFLWDKYESEFKWLLWNKWISFNYTSGEWISETTTLRILNLIWKNIWIPESKTKTVDLEQEKELKYFKTIADARLMFEDIKLSSIINWVYIEKGVDTQVVEKKLYNDGKINLINWKINFTKW